MRNWHFRPTHWNITLSSAPSPLFITVKAPYVTLLVFAVLALGFFFGSSYSRWTQGVVIAEDASGDFKIRQIPAQPPGLNDGYAYRCEVWQDGRLQGASTLLHPDFAAQPGKCHIEVTSPSRVVFDVDGYKIEYAGSSGDSPATATWKQLDQ